MKDLVYWKQKVALAFHDPPGKPFASFPHAGGQWALAKKLFKKSLPEPLHYYNRPSDWAAAGADRPMLTVPRRRGLSPFMLTWWDKPIITHPLAGGFTFRVAHPDELEESKIGVSKRDLAAIERDIHDQIMVAFELSLEDEEWENKDALRQGFMRTWRRFRDDLAARPGRCRQRRPALG